MTSRADLKALYRSRAAEDFPPEITVSIGDQSRVYRKVSWPTAGTGLDEVPEVGLRYGENPHQPAAFYAPAEPAGLGALRWIKLGKGGPSWINLADVEHALRILRYFDGPAACVMKHLNPAGVAVAGPSRTLAQTYEAARDCDARAAFGGVVGLNFTVDAPTAEAIASSYVEVVAAPGFAPSALEILSGKKDLRLAMFGDPRCLPRFEGDPVPAIDLKVASDGSILAQRPFLTRIRSTADFVLRPEAGGHRVEREPGEGELADLLFAWHVNLGVRSNGVVFACESRTLAIGTGEQERIGAIEQAIAKAEHKGHSLEGAVMSSDAFFPFRDAIDACARAGVRAIVQPGGSVRDPEVVQACNEHQIAMVYTQERCFAHF